MSRTKKTEHACAKNGGGYWGPRGEAKSHSNKMRRAVGKKTIQKEIATTLFNEKEFTQ